MDTRHIYRHGYRPDIDGLRALAVLAVLLFHAQIPPFTGGFVGVDIFFVISGYLITRNVLADIGRGRFSFATFLALFGFTVASLPNSSLRRGSVAV